MISTKSNVDLEKDSIPKLFLNYCIPILITMIMTSSYTLVDGIFVSIKLGDKAMSSIALVWPLFPVIMATSMLFAIGGSSFISFYLAKNRFYVARLIFSSIIYSVFPISIIVGILLYFNAHYVVDLLAQDLSYDVRRMSIEYLQGIFILLFGVFLQPILDMFMINNKSPKYATFCVLISAITNIILDYFFLFILEIGIIGSSYATSLALVMGAFLLILGFNKKRGSLYFIKDFNAKVIFKSMLLGIPIASSEISSSFTMWLYTYVLRKIDGEDALTIYSSILYTGFMFFTILLAIAQTVQPIASFNYGLRKFERLKEIIKFFIICMFLCGVVLYFIFFMFDFVAVYLFIQNPDLREKSKIAMNIYYTSYIFLGINLLISIYLQSIQKTFASFIVTIFYTLIFITIFLPTLSFYFGMNGAWVSNTVSQFLAFIVSTYILIHQMKNINAKK